MKTLYIHTTIDATGAVLSLGDYWDCSGRQPIETPWEYIGDEPGLMLAIGAIREDRDAEFMHVINRSSLGGNMENETVKYCEYYNCVEVATIYDADLKASLCEYHKENIENSSGYCGPSCRLGYGCDQSC